MLLSLWVHKYLFKALLSIPLVIYPEAELLDGNSIFYFLRRLHRVGHDWATELNWRKRHTVFHHVSTIYVPTRSVQRFHFLHILINTGHFLSFFSAFWPFVYLLWGICKPFAHFWIKLFDFSLSGHSTSLRDISSQVRNPIQTPSNGSMES